MHTQAYKEAHEDSVQLSKIYELLSPDVEECVLDLGTGNGYLAFYGANTYQRSSFIGLDIADKAIKRNQEIRKDQKLENIRFMKYEGVRLPFKDKKFHKIVTRIAFHHFPEAEESIQEMFRVLKDDGTIVIADAIKYSDDKKDFINRFQGLKKDGHVKFYEEDEMIQMFKEEGFYLKSSFTTYMTYSRKYNEHYIRLIKETPSDIKQKYQVSFINDQVYVTVQIINFVFKKFQS